MKIVVLNGTEIKGCTWHIKELFLNELRDGNEITEFYFPKDLPVFCKDCKACFFKYPENCPASEYMDKIRQTVYDADLLVFAYPVYELRVPASLKNLLDHMACNWMVHKPSKAMFNKRAVILTNSIGPGFMDRAAQKDVKTSLTWMGVSSVKCVGIGLLEDVIWKALSVKRKNVIAKKIRKAAADFKDFKPVKHMSLAVGARFIMCKKMHAAILKNETTPSTDNQCYLDNGWIKDTRKNPEA